MKKTEVRVENGNVTVPAEFIKEFAENYFEKDEIDWKCCETVTVVLGEHGVYIFEGKAKDDYPEGEVVYDGDVIMKTTELQPGDSDFTFNASGVNFKNKKVYAKFEGTEEDGPEYIVIK